MKKSRSGKKLWISTISSLALLGATAAWRSYINADPQIVIPPYPSAPKPNGFDVYVKAASLIRQTAPYVDYPSDPSPPTDAKILAQQYSLARKTAWLQKSAAGFALMQSAFKMKCLPPSSRELMSFPPYGKLRELARCKTVERHACEMRGDWNGAVQSQLDTIQMGNGIAQDGALMTGLVAIAIGAIGRDAPWQNVEKLNVTQARAATKRLETIYNRRFTLVGNLKEDKWISLSFLKMAFADPKSEWRDGGTMLNKPSILERVKLFCVSKRAVAFNVARRLDTQIANSQLPYTTPPKPLPSGDPISGDFVPGFDKLRAVYARNDAGNALWLVALALRAYKSEHNAYPLQLRVLVPNYLKSVPADPFGGGASLRYKIVGNSYLLWSIGPDGVNNNGAPIPFRVGQLATSRNRLPQVDLESRGDYVAGKNR